MMGFYAADSLVLATTPNFDVAAFWTATLSPKHAAAATFTASFIAHASSHRPFAC